MVDDTERMARLKELQAAGATVQELAAESARLRGVETTKPEPLEATTLRVVLDEALLNMNGNSAEWAMAQVAAFVRGVKMPTGPGDAVVSVTFSREVGAIAATEAGRG